MFTQAQSRAVANLVARLQRGDPTALTTVRTVAVTDDRYHALGRAVYQSAFTDRSNVFALYEAATALRWAHFGMVVHWEQREWRRTDHAAYQDISTYFVPVTGTCPDGALIQRYLTQHCGRDVHYIGFHESGAMIVEVSYAIGD